MTVENSERVFTCGWRHGCAPDSETYTSDGGSLEAGQGVGQWRRWMHEKWTVLSLKG